MPYYCVPFTVDSYLKLGRMHVGIFLCQSELLMLKIKIIRRGEDQERIKSNQIQHH